MTPEKILEKLDPSRTIFVFFILGSIDIFKSNVVVSFATCSYTIFGEAPWFEETFSRLVSNIFRNLDFFLE